MFPSKTETNSTTVFRSGRDRWNRFGSAWLLNSPPLSIGLTGLLSLILLRTMKNDIARYLQVDDMDQAEVALSRTERN